jgi:hypothetical protein
MNMDFLDEFFIEPKMIKPKLAAVDNWESAMTMSPNELEMLQM